MKICGGGRNRLRAPHVLNFGIVGRQVINFKESPSSVHVLKGKLVGFWEHSGRYSRKVSGNEFPIPRSPMQRASHVTDLACKCI